MYRGVEVCLGTRSVFCDFDVLMENILGDGTEQSG
jgi:hypothetical protein